MQHGALVEKDFGAGVAQDVQVVAAGEIEEAVVGARGGDDAHATAGARLGGDESQEHLVGHDVGGDEREFAPAVGGEGDELVPDGVVGEVGPAAHDLDTGGASRRGLHGQLGAEGFGVAVGGETPVGGEDAREVGDGGPFDERAEITETAFAGRGAGVLAREVLPAHDGRAAVEHGELAVVAQVGRVARLPGGHRHESRELAPGVRELAEQRVVGVARAQVVHQHAHLHALARAGGQQAHEFSPGGVGAEDVGEQLDARTGARDLLAQREEGRGAVGVVQERHAVARRGGVLRAGAVRGRGPVGGAHTAGDAGDGDADAAHLMALAHAEEDEEEQAEDRGQEHEEAPGQDVAGRPAFAELAAGHVKRE